MRQLTIGVIGHVDHGKTSLTRALTGIDTDRLPEEKARGMSIVPGFAWMECAGGTLDLVDVPGHEDFLRGMIAGAAGIDAVLLVVDAREGPRAQTAEHIAIAQLLGVQRGIVALNKMDLLAAHERDSSRKALRKSLDGTFLVDAPTVEVSAATGEGIVQLRGALESLLAAPRNDAEAAFHLAVDRAFVLPGQGTIVTGTLRGGVLDRGAQVEVLPAGLASHVRQLQVHGRVAERALPGQRVGVNLRGVKLEEVGRGCVIAAPGARQAASSLQAELTLLDGCSVRPGEMLRLFVGADSVTARVRGRAIAALQGPATVEAELRCERPVCAAPGERFVLRSDARHRTLGGGRVIALGPRRAAIDETVLHALEQQLMAALEEFHGAHPARDGAALSWWRGCIEERHRGRAFDAAVSRLRSAGRVEIGRDLVRRAGFDPMRDLPPQERRCVDEVERCFRDAGPVPPDVAEVVAGDVTRESVCRLLVARGRLVRVGSHGGAPVLFHRDALDAARQRLAQAFPPPATFTVSQARELVGSTRKYVVPLLEFLDASHFTQRRGDLRSVARPVGNPAPAPESHARR